MNDTLQKKITEDLELIATRVPPGDRWTLTTDSRKVIHNSLTDALEAYCIGGSNFKGNYKLAPLDGKLYAIRIVEEDIVPEPPRRFNIYGEPA